MYSYRIGAGDRKPCHVDRTPVPAFLFTNVPVAPITLSVTLSPRTSPVRLAAPVLIAAVVVPSYTLFKAVMPVIVNGLGVILAVVKLWCCLMYSHSHQCRMIDIPVTLTVDACPYILLANIAVYFRLKHHRLLCYLIALLLHWRSIINFINPCRSNRQRCRCNRGPDSS